MTLTFMTLTFAAQAQTKSAPAAKPAAPSEDAQLYRNTTFGFRYPIPYGWVDRTKEMLEGNDAKKGDLLLAVFERPPDATGDTINSAVVIASESAASISRPQDSRGLPGPAHGACNRKRLQGVGEPYSLEVESRQLLRADFVKVRSDKLAMRQCTLVLLAKGQIVSFTFIAGSDEELDDLMDGLHFVAAKASAH